MTKQIPKITITQEVFDEIKATIGKAPAETGGVLGGDPTTGVVTHFYYDRQSETSPVVYHVIADRINPVLAEWNAAGVHLMGMIHSHLRRHLNPSDPDIRFGHRLISRPDNVALPHFLIPIVQSAADGDFSMRIFSVLREAPDVAFELPYEIAQSASPFPVTDPLYARIFTRVRTSYDLHRLHPALVVVIGCGGAAAAIEDMVRAGVGRILLIDPDTVAESNLATQAYYLCDVGRPKVEVLRERLLRINPFARVDILADSLDVLSDDDVRSLLFSDAEISTRLLCGFTDSFWAQWRINLLALTMGVPALYAQVYRRGAAAEVVFTHPDSTHQCARCILSRRFDAFLRDGFRNDVGSDGAQVYATPRLNALKLFASLALLHHGSPHPFWGSMLERIGQRNCALIRCDPDVGTRLNLPVFDQVLAGATAGQTFVDETIWRPQHPENPANGYNYSCPDCGGTGNLLDSIGRFSDTRQLVRTARLAAPLGRKPV